MLKKMVEFEIDGIKISRDIRKENIATNKMRFFQLGETIIGRSLPNTLTFLGEEFFVDFYFENERLREIELEPLISGVESPGYPDLEYQQIKWDYGVDLLKREFGKPDYEDNSIIQYDYELGRILCFQYLTGRQVGEGGKIRIRYEQGEK